ncbi:hypothetical protein PFISCL1PPCAC_15615, partial [Pristionchus fissidentatus]
EEGEEEKEGEEEGEGGVPHTAFHSQSTQLKLNGLVEESESSNELLQPLFISPSIPLNSSLSSMESIQSSIQPSTPLIVIAEGISMNANIHSDDVIVLHQFNSSLSPIRDIVLSTSLSSEPLVEAELVLSERIGHSSASCIITERGELNKSPLDDEEEGTFEEYWEEIVVYHDYRRDMITTQSRRIALLNRIEESRRRERYQNNNSFRQRTHYERNSVESPHNYRSIDRLYSLDYRSVDSPSNRSIASIREENEDTEMSDEKVEDIVSIKSHNSTTVPNEKDREKSFDEMTMEENDEMTMEEKEKRNVRMVMEEAPQSLPDELSEMNETREECNEEFEIRKDNRVNLIVEIEEITHLRKIREEKMEADEIIDTIEKGEEIKKMKSEHTISNSIDEDTEESNSILGGDIHVNQMKNDEDERASDSITPIVTSIIPIMSTEMMHSSVTECITQISTDSIEMSDEKGNHKEYVQYDNVYNNGEEKRRRESNEIEIPPNDTIILLRNNDDHLNDEISEEVVYDRVASDEEEWSEQNIYEEINESTIYNKIQEVTTTQVSTSVDLNLALERKLERKDSGEYTEIQEEVEEEERNEERKEIDKVKLIEANDIVKKELTVQISREELPQPKRRRSGSFVDRMSKVWDDRLSREGANRACPSRIPAPKRRDFQSGETSFDIVDGDRVPKGDDIDTETVRAFVRPRSRSLCSPSRLFDDTPSIKTIRYFSVEGRSERSHIEFDDFYLGEVTVVTNDGVHLTEENLYTRNEYSELLDGMNKLRKRRSPRNISEKSNINRWNDCEDKKIREATQGTNPIKQYSSLDRESSISSPNIFHSRKKSVTFARDTQLVEYDDMREYSLKEVEISTVTKRERLNGVALIETQDSFTRNETRNDQSYSRHYERIEKRQPMNESHSVDLYDPPNISSASPRDFAYSDESNSGTGSPLASPLYSTRCLTPNNNNEKIDYGCSVDRSTTVSKATASQSTLSPTASLNTIVSAGSSTGSRISSIDCAKSTVSTAPYKPSLTAQKVSYDTESKDTMESIDRSSTVYSSSEANHGALYVSRALSQESVVKSAIVVSPDHSALALSQSTSVSHPPTSHRESSIHRSSSSFPHFSVDNYTQTIGMRVETGEVEVNGASIEMDNKLIRSNASTISQWDPTDLVRRLYQVSYEPRLETKRSRFINMEGHIEVPNEEIDEGFEKKWVEKYVKTRDGRLQFFVTHYADDSPVEEKLMEGCEVEVSREERTIRITGGRSHIKITLRVPSGLIDKWRHALLSHAASSSIDAYVRPIPSALPHMSERVVIIELGSCSIRGGVLTCEPSLPSSFFPSIASVLPNGDIVVGSDAYLPQNRLNGRLLAPYSASDPSFETYSINKDVMRACIRKVLSDCRVNPNNYKVLVSLPQNIPSVLIEDIMKILLEDLPFQGGAVTRQPSLVLYAYDVSTGIVVDIGERLSIIPVVDGYMVESGIVSLPHGGRQMQDCLRRLLGDNNRGAYGQDSIIDTLILRNIMEETCFVSQDPHEDNVNATPVSVSLSQYNLLPTMPKSLQVDNSRFLATEGLFAPKKWNLEGKGLHHLIHESIQNSPIDARRVLYRNIYLAGGASLLPGLAERLETELSKIVPSTIHSQVHISPWRYNASFLGAQVIASSSSFDESCITPSRLASFLEKLKTILF